MIRLGICRNSLDDVEVMKEIGYDYLELNMTITASLSEEDFATLLEQVKTAPLPVEAMNCMVPGDFVLCSEEGTGDRIKTYLTKAFSRAAQLGVQVVVFGSGGARALPEGISPEEGYQYLAEFLKVAAGIAAPYGLRIAIEPLCASGCNFIHCVEEAQKLEKMVNLPNVGSLADLYHMSQEKDKMDALSNEIGVIHCHIAEGIKRTFPVKGDDSEKDYRAFFDALKKGNYQGRVSIEGAAPEDFAKGIAASYQVLDALRKS